MGEVGNIYSGITEMEVAGKDVEGIQDNKGCKREADIMVSWKYDDGGQSIQERVR